ncbi:putative SOS response-associated peptidase YedK [Desulfofundulus luciae]|uniref:Abasic site processing protein n=1 Tax=Desulfofundulus luciae TaxID=74702 RepID=A0ABU0B3R9_9FIRM|nr:SOS response-associated peptidase [Desulfofundulus luciae]MDQ0287366.1 putative SOS response-associated peptidase YedK [Desulfofundulus luciae]
MARYCRVSAQIFAVYLHQIGVRTGVFIICGRFTLTVAPEAISKTFRVPCSIPYFPRYNIAPGQAVPVIVGGESGRLLKVMRWGLIPHWAKDASIGSRLVNARTETVLSKPAFRDSFRFRRRCLVPADGFYEWKREGKRSTPYRIVLPDKEVFAFAGLWDRWDSSEESVFSFAIITTEASESMKEIHSRMPVILSVEEEYGEWLEAGDFNTLRKLLRPYEGRLHIYPVSRLVNSPKNDMPELILEEENGEP